jgi:hypothetical protein
MGVMFSHAENFKSDMRRKFGWLDFVPGRKNDYPGILGSLQNVITVKQKLS